MRAGGVRLGRSATSSERMFVVSEQRKSRTRFEPVLTPGFQGSSGYCYPKNKGLLDGASVVHFLTLSYAKPLLFTLPTVGVNKRRFAHLSACLCDT